MRLRYLLILLITLVVVSNTGCQGTRSAGQKVGHAALALPFWFAEGIINGVFDSDESVVDRDRREHRERQWKQHWRDNPNDVRAMHDAFKDDYE